MLTRWPREVTDSIPVQGLWLIEKEFHCSPTRIKHVNNKE